MKYAFLFGSNAFITDKPVISSTLDGTQTELIKIKSIYKPASNGHAATNLLVDSSITGVNEHTIAFTDNAYSHSEYQTTITENQVHVTDNSGHTVIDVLQLLPEALHGLSSHVLNELNNIGDAIVIRIHGDFMIGAHRVTVDNEKLFIDDDVYAESVHVVPNGVELSPNGVVI